MATMTTITAGMTGAQFISAVNGNDAALNAVASRSAFYNVLDYGIVKDTGGATDQYTAIQALIETVKVNGGTIYFPPGNYYSSQLTLYSNVMLCGDEGTRSSFIIAKESDKALINLVHTTFVASNSGLRDLVLSGGTTTLYMQWCGLFAIRNCVFVNASVAGVTLCGALVGKFENCVFASSVIGVWGYDYNNHAIESNDITFEMCQFYSNTSWGLKWTSGNLVYITCCSFEVNGTSGDINTGTIYFKPSDLTSMGTVKGIVASECWIEANYGTTFYFDEDANQHLAYSHTIKDSFICFGIGTSKSTMRIVADAMPMLVLLSGNVIRAIGDIIITGAKATVLNTMTVFSDGVISGTGYYTSDATLV